MLRSLWSGVSGMQAHQVALDVESNNIANVNTNGFKYSRADFSTMVSQIKRSATIPYAGYGGINDNSVGLGTAINTTTKVFTQGSMQNTDRKGDLALSGNGMFVVSNNGGYTNMYTRDGAFLFDAVGNLVTTSGFIVQGWVRDLSKLGCGCGEGMLNKVDSTGPIGNIQIDPRLTIPARKTSVVQGNINLTSGNKTEHITCPSALDSTAANNYIAGGLDRRYDTNDRQMEIAQDMGVMFNDAGEAMRLQEGQGVWVSYQTATSRQLRIDSGTGASVTSSIKINGETITWTNDPTTSKSSHISATIVAINNYKDKTGVEAVQIGNNIVLQNLNQLDGNEAKKNIDVSIDTTGNPPARGILGGFLEATDHQGNAKSIWNEKVTTAFRYQYSKQTNADVDNGHFRTTEDLRQLMQYDANKVKKFGGDSAAAGAAMPSVKNTFDTAADAGMFSQSSHTVAVTLNSNGQFEINNKHDGAVADSATTAAFGAAPRFDQLNIFVSAFNHNGMGTNDPSVTTNVLFKNQMRAMNTGILSEGGQVTTTAGLRLAKYGQTLEIYDSLGNKHEFTMEFTKVAQSQWSFRLVVPEPAEFLGSTSQRPNILEGGSITFGENGELLGVNPSMIQFRPNSGASSPQSIELDFGSNGTLDGITSTARESQSNSVTGDGYAAGILRDYYFDKTGTMIGVFDNGQNLALAQVAVATFANYEGLQETGNNLYMESPNSGNATVGAAGTGGRADIEASKLEMSNTDLSRGLTQLIVVQRGFQASSKSVTTSDQVLNTLLGLKQ